MSRKPTLFIIEGPDGSGKTKLARFIANSLNAAYFHATHTPALTGQAQLDYLENLLESAEVCMNTSGLDVVMDRQWPSERVYGQMFRNSVDNTKKLREKVSRLPHLYIFCKGDYTRYLATNTPGHILTQEQYIALDQSYHDLATDLIVIGEPVMSYNIDQHGFDVGYYLANMFLYLEKSRK